MMNKKSELRSPRFSENSKCFQWCITINADQSDGQLVQLDNLLDFVREFCKDWVFQLENAKFKPGDEVLKRSHFSDHWQMFISLKEKKTKEQLLSIFDSLEYFHRGRKGVHVERVKEKDKYISYCQKVETRVMGPYLSHKYNTKSCTYMGEDLMEIKTNPFPWQQWLSSLLLTAPDDRRITFIWNGDGNVGKSKFVKYYCFSPEFSALRIPFGSHQQIREILVKSGPRKMYFIDIPKTLGKGEDLDTVISVIEDLKNGFVQSFMHGKFDQLFMSPPHVVCFSNYPLRKGLFSTDRWQTFCLTSRDQTEFEELSMDKIPVPRKRKTIKKGELDMDTLVKEVKLNLLEDLKKKQKSPKKVSKNPPIMKDNGPEILGATTDEKSSSSKIHIKNKVVGSTDPYYLFENV